MIQSNPASSLSSGQSPSSGLSSAVQQKFRLSHVPSETQTLDFMHDLAH